MMPLIMGLMKSAKFWGILGGTLGLLSLATWGYNQVYSAGFNAAVIEYQTQQIHAVDEAVADARAEWQLSAKAAEAEIVVETIIQEKIRYVEREVPKVVERVVRAECRDLGPDIQRLFNEAIRAGSDHERSGPDFTADTPS